MTDAELNLKLKNLVVEERKLTRVVLEHIAEVERRKLYLRIAYPSLFDYLVKEIGYSANAAQRRIDAARTILAVPEVAEKVEAGALNLSQITKMRKICREKRKSGERISAERQREVLAQIESRGERETDLILAREFQTKIEVMEKRHIQRDESVRVELTFSKEEMQLLQEAQAILSHASGGGLKETLLAMARKTVAVRDRMSTTTAVVKRRDAWKCQFKDRRTGKICGSTHFLEIDHVQPRFAGGGNEPENLRVLCRNHNQFRYRAGL